MARPTKNFAISQRIIVGVAVNMVGFPAPSPLSAPIVPHQRFPASLTLPINYSPTRLYNIIWERHNTPPNADYTTKRGSVKLISNPLRRLCYFVSARQGNLIGEQALLQYTFGDMQNTCLAPKIFAPSHWGEGHQNPFIQKSFVNHFSNWH